MEIITRAEAMARKPPLKRYFTGKRCKRGHVAERWVCDFQCVACKNALQNTEEHKAYQRSYREAHEEKLAGYARAYRQGHYRPVQKPCIICDRPFNPSGSDLTCDRDECRQEFKRRRGREHYWKNVEWNRAAARRFREQHPEYVAHNQAQLIIWRKENADHIREYSSRYDKEHREEKSEAFLQWYVKKNNPTRELAELHLFVLRIKRLIRKRTNGK